MYEKMKLQFFMFIIYGNHLALALVSAAVLHLGTLGLARVRLVTL